MSTTDGREVFRGPIRKGIQKKERHYDRVWKALEQSSVRMLGDHGTKGGTYTFHDPNDVKVGEVTFGREDEFRGGRWYGKIVVTGRTVSVNEAFSQFLDLIEQQHRRH